jgi:hypothetical protein
MQEARVFRQRAILADVAAARGLVEVKRTALLFDDLVILQTKEGQTDRRVKETPLQGVPFGQIEWLTDRGIVSFVQDPSDELFDNKDPELVKFEDYRRASLGHVLLVGGEKQEEFIKSSANFVARYSASHLSAADSESQFIPLAYEPRFRLDQLGAQFEYPFSAADIDRYKLATANVFAKIAVPDELTPWEAIMDFRNDPENKAAFVNLRKFIRDSSGSTKPAVEFQDELESNILKTTNALKRAKIKCSDAVLEASVVSAVSVIENLIKIKWSKLLKPLFDIKKARHNYLEAEAKIAESSSYYIVKANEAFGPR